MRLIDLMTPGGDLLSDRTQKIRAKIVTYEKLAAGTKNGISEFLPSANEKCCQENGVCLSITVYLLVLTSTRSESHVENGSGTFLILDQRQHILGTKNCTTKCTKDTKNGIK